MAKQRVSYKRLAQAQYDFAYCGDQKVKEKIWHLAGAIFIWADSKYRDAQIKSACKKFRCLALKSVPSIEIQSSAAAILNLAKLTGGTISIVFNNVVVTARPGSTVKRIVEQYHKDYVERQRKS